MVEIFGQNQTSKFSKPFRVDVGKVVVISSFNFGCEQQDIIGNVTKEGDCAILHKIELEDQQMPTGSACTGCASCLLDGVDLSVANSEPVVVCGELWTHNAENNLTVLTVPGAYMFELCDESAIGTVSIKIEELTVEQASLLPKSLIHGEC